MVPTVVDWHVAVHRLTVIDGRAEVVLALAPRPQTGPMDRPVAVDEGRQYW